MRPFFERDGIRIFHGEALEILPTLANLDAIVTDSPYSSGGAFRSDRALPTAVKYQNTGSAALPEFSGDHRDQKSFAFWSTMWLMIARRACKPGAPVMTFTDWRQLPVTTDAVQAAGWTWRGIATWSKRYGRAVQGRFSSAAEFVVWGSNGPMKNGPASPAGVFECQPPRNKVHIAQKPVEVMSWLLKIIHSGSTICDPFMGSGSTLLAAHLAGLSAIGIDADERSCELAATRLAQQAASE